MSRRRRRRTEALDGTDAESERLHLEAGRTQLREDVLREELQLARPDAVRHFDVEDAALETERPGSPRDARTDGALPVQKRDRRPLDVGRHGERQRRERAAELDRRAGASAHGATKEAMK
jgi:hypothetical protein